jgi:dolichol-phosphate mannosyltransferase
VRLTVIVPTFNEAENLPHLVSALFNLPLEDVCLLVVDDNSPDGTGQLADQLASEQKGRMGVIHRPQKMGLGPAYLAGFSHALGAGAEAIGQMDADFSHPLEKIPDLMEALQCCDVAMGSRYVPGGSLDERWPLWRKGLSAFANFYARSILGFPIRDATGGFRIWRRETLLGMPLKNIRTSGYSFMVELAYLTYLLGFSYREVPIHFADRRWGQSKMSFNIQREAALRVWKMRFEYRHLKRRS